MSVGGTVRIVGALGALGFALVGPVAAMDLTQSAPADSSSSSSFALPSFLDGARLPDLRDAFNLGETSPTPALGAQAPDGEPDSAERIEAEQAAEEDRQARAVRARAEALSQRFGSENSADGAEGETAGSESGPGQDASQVATEAAGPAGAEVSDPRSAVPNGVSDSALVRAKPLTSARRLGAAIAKERNVEGVARGSVALPERSPTRPAERKPNPPAAAQAKTQMPTQLRAFGWDSQPE